MANCSDSLYICTNFKYWDTGTYQWQTVFSLQHTHVEPKWRTCILPTSVESENMYSSLNTYWLNKIIFPQTHICWITPLHVHSLSRGVGETQRRKEYVTHLKHELKVSLCVCLFLQRWNIYFQVQEFVIPKNFQNQIQNKLALPIFTKMNNKWHQCINEIRNLANKWHWPRESPFKLLQQS